MIPKPHGMGRTIWRELEVDRPQICPRPRVVANGRNFREVGLHQCLSEKKVKERRFAVVKNTGDGMLVEFASNRRDYTVQRTLRDNPGIPGDPLARSLLRHSGLAQPGEVSRFRQGPDCRHSRVSIGVTRNAPETTVAA
jgi:hypothetical protein